MVDHPEQRFRKPASITFALAGLLFLLPVSCRSWAAAEGERVLITESSLSPESDLSFHDATLLKTYRWELALIGLAVLGQAGLICWLFYERRRRHALEILYRQRLTELARLNRYSAAGELAVSLAHELNQPLGAILTNAETAELLLRSHSPDAGHLREILADIRRDNQRASEVIRRLGSLLKKRPFELIEFNLTDTVKEVIGFLSGIATARNINLRYVAVQPAVSVKGDPIQIQQVVLNILMNAMDALCSSQALRREIIVSTKWARGEAEIVIADTGPGISTEDLKGVFNPFFTTKPHGMGMGLTIARTIVEVHQGRLSVEPRKAGGALFRVRLPAAG